MYKVAGSSPAVSIYLFKKKLMDKFTKFVNLLILFSSLVSCFCFVKLHELSERFYSLEGRLFELQSENHILLQKVNLLTSKSIEPVVLQKIAENGANIDLDFYAGLFLLGVFGICALYIVFYTNDGSPSTSFGSEVPCINNQNALPNISNNFIETVGQASSSSPPVISSPTPPVMENFADFALRNSEKLGKFGTWLQAQPYPLESSFSVIEMSTRSYIYVTTIISDPSFHESCVLKMKALGLII